MVDVLLCLTKNGFLLLFKYDFKKTEALRIPNLTTAGFELMTFHIIETPALTTQPSSTLLNRDNSAQTGHLCMTFLQQELNSDIKII